MRLNPVRKANVTMSYTVEKESIPPMQQRISRDDGTTFISIFHFLISGLFLLGTVLFALPTLLLGIVALTQAAGAFIGMFAVGLITTVLMVFCLLYLSVGYGLWTLRQWARIAAIALAIIILFAVPAGTLIGGLILWHLLKPEVAAQFE